ncbi:hypothetical protein Agabi119p4_2639 [Agaricus bisporus var. burnettii]|uniref:F-box domain-containing protein n=1 Tax=Agaricus bisporus var. burnettii TaxID=192524 RepID=A0A8H7F9J3_AGABI|nr:hypothetical protein Agabi119p4_2639 [Agaricus bisporus var. burnettii]
MASEANVPQCGHLRPHTAPYVFVNEQAELIHVNEQLSSVGRHIAELNTLQSTLRRRTLQLHNLLSPIHTLPIEILSYIFQLVVTPESYDHSNASFYRECLDQALVLSSVTSQFRHIAFGTPELWNRIPLRITKDKTIDNASSMLQHCVARASSVTICVSDRLNYESGGDLHSVIETLLTSETTRKVKAFELYSLYHASSWMSKLDSSSFPMVESLIITCGIGTKHLSGFDFGTLNNLTQLDIDGTWRDFSLTAPPSVLYLNIYRVPQKMFLSLLYQCPNLVECSADTGRELDGPPFTKPIILKHLKRLHTGTMNAITRKASLQHLQLPSLESLHLDHFTKRRSLGIVPLCCNVSATLTSLTIHTYSIMFDHDELYQLCRVTFPKLRDLKFTTAEYFLPLASAFRALSPRDYEYNNPRPLHLPALRSITLHSDVAEVEPRVIVHLLKNWWSDEALHLHLEFQSYSYNHQKDWTPELREELKSIVGKRQIEIIWGRDKL